MFSDEKWRPVPGLQGLYSCSNKGRFRSEPRTCKGNRDGVERIVRGRILSIIVDNLTSPNPTTRVQFRHDGKYIRYRIPLLYKKIWGSEITTSQVLASNADTLPNGVPVISIEPFGVFWSSSAAGEYFGGTGAAVRASAQKGRYALFHTAKPIKFRFLTDEELFKYRDIIQSRSYYVDK